MSTNTLIALQVKAYIQSFTSSLLYCVFLDQEHSQLLLHYAVVVEGDALYYTDLTDRPRQTVKKILNAKDEYSVDHDAGKKLLDSFIAEWKEKQIASIIGKFKENNTGEIDYFLKKVIDHSFQVDNTKLEHAGVLVSHGEIEVVNALERSGSFTVAQRTEIAEKYVGKDPSSIKDVVTFGKEDTVVAILHCGSSGKISAAATLFFNRLSGRILSCSAISGELAPDQFSEKVYPVDMYHFIEEKNKTGNGATAEAVAIRKKIESVSVNDFARVFAVDESSVFSALMANVLKGTIPFDTLKAHVLVFNSIIADIIFNPAFSSQNKDDMDDDPTAKIPTIAVDLALSPAKGVKLSELQTGSRIYVIINASNPLGKRVVSQLNLMDENNRVKPVGGVVESVTRDRKNNFIVLVRLSSKLLGRAVEEEDIKVKSGDPVADIVMKKSSSALVIGLITGFFVIAIVIAALVFFL